MINVMIFLLQTQNDSLEPLPALKDVKIIDVW